MDEVESTFFDPFWVFQDVPNSHFLLVSRVVFQCPHLRRVKTLARFSDPAGCFDHQMSNLHDFVREISDVGMS